MHIRATVALLALATSACAFMGSSYNGEKDAMLRLEGDQSVQINWNGRFAVSPFNKQSLADRNLALAVRRALESKGLSVTEDTDYTYVLSVGLQYKTAEYEGRETVQVESHSFGSVGDRTVAGSTTSTASVPVERKTQMRLLRFKLYDAHDIMKDVPLVWTGGLVGRTATIDAHLQQAIKVLVDRLGDQQQKQSYVVHCGETEARVEVYR